MAKRTKSGRFVAKCISKFHTEWESSDDSKLIKLHILPNNISYTLKHIEGFARAFNPKWKNKYMICSDCVLYINTNIVLNPSTSSTSETDLSFNSQSHLELDHSYSETDLSFNSQSHLELDHSYSASSISTSSSDNETGSELKTVKEQRKFDDSKSEIEEKEAHSVDYVIELLKNFSESELASVANFIGKSQVQSVRNDVENLKRDYLDIDNLGCINLQDWIFKRNQVVVNFLDGVSGKSKPLDPKSLYKLAKTTEQVYGTITSRAVLPFSFSENIVTYSVATSKINANINGFTGPAGSYWTVKKWLENLSSNPLPIPKGDCLIAFDNDQVIGKTYNVRENSKVKVSIVTSVCAAEVDKNGTLQKLEALKPSLWERKLTESEEINLCNNKSKGHEILGNIAYTELEQVLKETIDSVSVDQSLENHIFKDNIDDLVKSVDLRRNWKVCGQCGTHNAKTKRICEGCKLRLKETEGIVQEGDAEPTTKEEKPTLQIIVVGPKEGTKGSSYPDAVKITARDPIFVNPNSYATVKEVLLKIGKDLGVRGYTDGEPCREWLTIICDGVPYCLALKLLKETFRCEHCRSSIFRKVDLLAHYLEEHSVPEALVNFNLEFGWVHLRIGYGHFEMNMVRAFFSFNWLQFMNNVAYEMGFRTENAQKYARKGSDHHKSWELLNIFYRGTLAELLVPYVRDCMRKKIDPSPTGYLNWSKHVKNPNYWYMQEQVLTYAQAILNFRKGVRTNDWKLIKAGMFKFSPVFHGRNHPKYQQIELKEAMNELIMPDPVKTFAHQHQALGKENRKEDMDFQLENLNKRSKAWVPKGTPTEGDWQRIFRNLDHLDKVRSETFARIGASDPKETDAYSYSSRHVVHEKEVNAWRRKLRESQYLLKPMQEEVMQAISGNELDAQLPNFTELAWSRRRSIYEALFCEKDNIQVLDPVFVTPQEREAFHNIANQTKEVIANRIFEMLSQLDSVQVKLSLEQEWQSVKSKKKENYLMFFARVEEELDAQNNRDICEELPDSDDNDD